MGLPLVMGCGPTGGVGVPLALQTPLCWDCDPLGFVFLPNPVGPCSTCSPLQLRKCTSVSRKYSLAKIEDLPKMTSVYFLD